MALDAAAKSPVKTVHVTLEKLNGFFTMGIVKETIIISTIVGIAVGCFFSSTLHGMYASSLTIAASVSLWNAYVQQRLHNARLIIENTNSNNIRKICVAVAHITKVSTEE